MLGAREAAYCKDKNKRQIQRQKKKKGTILQINLNIKFDKLNIFCSECAWSTRSSSRTTLQRRRFRSPTSPLATLSSRIFLFAQHTFVFVFHTFHKVFLMATLSSRISRGVTDYKKCLETEKNTNPRHWVGPFHLRQMRKYVKLAFWQLREHFKMWLFVRRYICI